MMNRVFSRRMPVILLCIVLVISAAIVSVHAEEIEAPEIAIELGETILNKVASPIYTDARGDYYIVTVDLNVTSNAGFLCIKGDLTYPEEFTLVDIVDGELTEGTELKNLGSLRETDLAANPYKVAYAATLSETDITNTGTLVSFKFRAPVDIECTDYALSFTPTEISNAAYEIVTDRATAVASGSINVLGTALVYRGADAFTTYLDTETAVTPAQGSDPSLVHITAASDSTRVSISPAIDASEYPYVKVFYRTNITEGNSLAQMTSMTISFTEDDSERDRVGCVIDSSDFPSEADTWGSAIYDLTTGNLGLYHTNPVYGIGATGSFSTGDMPDSNYYDIGYIGFFATLEDAVSATFEPLYAVSFVSEGEVFATQSIWEHETGLAYPKTTPSKFGAVFSEWSIQEGTPVTEDTTVYASYIESSVYYGTSLIDPVKAYNIYYMVRPKSAVGSDPRLYHITGSYNSSENIPTIQFTGTTIDAYNFPIVKIYYRTDVSSEDSTLATPVIYATASDWKTVKLTAKDSSNLATKAGEWGYIIADLNRTGIFSASAKLRSIDLDRFIAQGAEGYIDISYIGFFPTEEAALATTYEPEYQVSFITNGELFATQDIWQDGVKLVYPTEEPAEENLIFTGWDIAEGSAIYGDTTVIATYVDSIIYSAQSLIDPKTAYGEAHYTSPKDATDTDPRLLHITPSSGLASYGEIRFTGDYGIYAHRTPYIKVYYRTNLAGIPTFTHTASDWSVENKAATVVESGDAPAVGDNWKYVILDISNARYSKDVYCRGINVSSNFESGSSDYIDIAYIGLFTTLEAAEREALEPVHVVTFVFENEVFATQNIWKTGGALVLPTTTPDKIGETFVAWVDHKDNVAANGTQIDFDTTYYATFKKPLYYGDTLIDPVQAYSQWHYTRPTAASGSDPRLLRIKYSWLLSSFADIRFTGKYAVYAHETPYVKIYYRTNLTTDPVFTHTASDWSFEKKAATVLESSKIPATGEWGYAILDISHANYSESVSCRSIDLSVNFAKDSSKYIDVAYIGFFTSEEEAKAAKYAVIEPDVTVTFMVDGVEYSKSTVEFGTALVYPETDPVMDGYRFAGWSVEEGSAIMENTTVTARLVVVGDVNGDGKVSPVDTAYLARYIAKWTGYGEDKIDLVASDVNNSGTVTAADTAVIARHISKWLGYETLPYVK